MAKSSKYGNIVFYRTKEGALRWFDPDKAKTPEGKAKIKAIRSGRKIASKGGKITEMTQDRVAKAKRNLSAKKEFTANKDKNNADIDNYMAHEKAKRANLKAKKLDNESNYVEAKDAYKKASKLEHKARQTENEYQRSIGNNERDKLNIERAKGKIEKNTEYQIRKDIRENYDVKVADLMKKHYPTDPDNDRVSPDLKLKDAMSELHKGKESPLWHQDSAVREKVYNLAERHTSRQNAKNLADVRETNKQVDKFADTVSRIRKAKESNDLDSLSDEDYEKYRQIQKIIGEKVQKRNKNKEASELKWNKTPYGFKEANYKGYTMSDGYIKGKVTVDIGGDEAVFSSVKEAQAEIDRMTAPKKSKSSKSPKTTEMTPERKAKALDALEKKRTKENNAYQKRQSVRNKELAKVEDYIEKNSVNEYQGSFMPGIAGVKEGAGKEERTKFYKARNDYNRIRNEFNKDTGLSDKRDRLNIQRAKNKAQEAKKEKELENIAKTKGNPNFNAKKYGKYYEVGEDGMARVKKGMEEALFTRLANEQNKNRTKKRTAVNALKKK